jgi:hypothetical protein
VNAHGSSTSSKPSMTNGFPPKMTWSRTSFSNCSVPLLAILSYEMRSTYWKLSAVSTKVRTSKSGGMGSNDACGLAAGIVGVGGAQAQAPARRGSYNAFVQQRVCRTREVCNLEAAWAGTGEAEATSRECALAPRRRLHPSTGGGQTSARDAAVDSLGKLRPWVGAGQGT